ncbi:hypothetical protein PIB30_017238 [Stylosanthes scabra]|uniref:Uncharacterized protein n=1 Tax=Stylosanthes scabra TaxID=79078 RepID=A0ABU6Z6K9_9FABA|nr:hypothetical protein [Stylosanthes scabra]
MKFGTSLPERGTYRTLRDRILRPSELGGNCSEYWAYLAQTHIRPPLCRPKATFDPDPYKGPTTSITGSTQDQDHICIDLEPPRVYKEEISSPPGTSSKPYPIAVYSEIPKSLFGDPSPTHYHSLIVNLSLLPWYLRSLRKSQIP